MKHKIRILTALVVGLGPCRLLNSKVVLTSLSLLILLVSLPDTALASNPPGTYQTTCQQITVVGTTTLVARCLDASHQLAPPSILQNFNQCIGDIRNDNGALHCNKGTVPPPGSYTQACRYIYTDGSTLIASCSDAAGQLGPPTSLQNFNQCTGDIRNDNGVLHCNTGPPPPGGSYTQSCQYAYSTGTTLIAYCKTGTGQSVWTSLPDFTSCTAIANSCGQLWCAAGAPAGSYQQSCCSIMVNRNALRATCATLGISAPFYSRNSELRDPNGCQGPVFNIDGYLSCSRGPKDPPPGSYQRTCIDPNFDGTSLSAQCETAPNGPLQAASTSSLAGCSDIANQSGSLSCVCSPQITASIAKPANQPTLTVSGKCFLPNHTITIQATDETMSSPTYQKNLLTQPTTSDANGLFSTSMTLSCKSGINLKITATDGRQDPKATYNVVWSNIVSVTCP